MLHIVNKSPFERNAFESCIHHLNAGDSIIMIEDAAVGAMDNTAFSSTLSNIMGTTKVYVLGGDLSARGLSHDRLIKDITVVDYTGFVDLVVENQTSQSWL